MTRVYLFDWNVKEYCTLCWLTGIACNNEEVNMFMSWWDSNLLHLFNNCISSDGMYLKYLLVYHYLKDDTLGQFIWELHMGNEPGNSQKKWATGSEIYSSVSRQQESMNKLLRQQQFWVSCMDTVAGKKSCCAVVSPLRTATAAAAPSGSGVTLP